MSFQTLRQKYKDYKEGDDISHTAVQPKYDGWWSNIISEHNGAWSAFSRTEAFLKEGVSLRPRTQLVGEYLFGTQWSKNHLSYGRFVIFDCTQLDGTDIRNEPYRNRLAFAKLAVQDCPLFLTAETFSIINHERLWTACLNGTYEGLVFRDLKAKYNAPIIRKKVVFEETGTAIGFTEGKGKHSGRLGAVKILLPNGAETDIGGGFDDAQREHIWENQKLYLGKKMDIAGKAKFKSGLLRHPNFIRWKDE